jgi:hypothetical protein
MMDYFGVGHEQYFPTSLASTHAPIEVFAVEKIPFIERSYICNHFPAHHHTGTGDSLYLDRLLRKGLMVQKEIGRRENVS